MPENLAVGHAQGICLAFQIRGEDEIAGHERGAEEAAAEVPAPQNASRARAKGPQPAVEAADEHAAV